MRGGGKRRLRALLSTKIAVALLLISVITVAATIYYYYTSTVTVSVEAPKINWVTGGDVAATISGNKSYCTVSIDHLQPNATTVYTSALKFTVLNNGTVKLQIASVTDNNGIIWGMRFYIYETGAGSRDLELVDGSHVTVTSIVDQTPVDVVGYRASGAPSGYGDTTPPIYSTGFDETAATTTYVIVLEAYGEETCQVGESATIELRLIWTA